MVSRRCGKCNGLPERAPVHVSMCARDLCGVVACARRPAAAAGAGGAAAAAQFGVLHRLQCAEHDRGAPRVSGERIPVRLLAAALPSIPAGVPVPELWRGPRPAQCVL